MVAVMDKVHMLTPRERPNPLEQLTSPQGKTGGGDTDTVGFCGKHGLADFTRPRLDFTRFDLL